MPTITLIGYRGTGKSSVAEAVARLLGRPWWDADAELERVVGCSIADLVRSRGEAAFRDEESRRLVDLLARRGDVVATGGGVILRPENRELLRSRGGFVAWLTAPAEVIRMRLAADRTTASRRPALGGSDVLAEVEPALRQREPLYRECATASFDASRASPEEIAHAIVTAAGMRQPSDAEGVGPPGVTR